MDSVSYALARKFSSVSPDRMILGVVVDAKLNGIAHVAYIKESIANFVRFCDLCQQFLVDEYRTNEKKAAIGSETSAPVYYQVLPYQEYAAVRVLAGTLPLDLQVEWQSFLPHTLRLNRDLHYGPIHVSVYEIERDVESNRTHPAMAPGIDQVESPQNIDDFDRRFITVYTDGSKSEKVSDLAQQFLIMVFLQWNVPSDLRRMLQYFRPS